MVFGTYGYKEQEENGQNTRWIYEKNMQGPPYFEALVRDFSSDAARFRLHDALREVHSVKAFALAPRIEIWLDPQRLQKDADDSTIVGTLLLGSWDDRLKKTFREQEPYRSEFTRKGPRNDHYEPTSIGDIRFATMADRLKSLMEKVGRFE